MPTSPRNASDEQLARWELARKQVGGAIKELRQRSGLTQEALAIESGVTRNMLIHLEHGTRPIAFDRLYDLAVALDVDVTSFFTTSTSS
jgi:transcriptional regulator with XRE-family HTH domain